ncbi:hypothetical protein OSB04_005456 [Centaurea solstitialis]|uniref:UspA domain-containing protein n=1 Tax=Centaurea solstitialis TaxID=347529 RepID=A0AA38TTY3_9ASTR|nr:hypothetical protein OSB04_005456 [Centaurea solstitialis]
MPSSESSFLRQLSQKEGWKLKSKRYSSSNSYNAKTSSSNGSEAYLMQQMEGRAEVYGSNGGRYGSEKRKRVMVVVDESIHSKHAMLWALTHVANKGDMLTLLQICPNLKKESESCSAPANQLVTSLGSLCKACKPQVEVEALVIEGPKLATVVSQVKKLEVSVLVLGQKNSSSFFHCLGGMSSTEKFVEQCINTVECLTIGVRKQSKGIGGYLISTRWQKDFWLLA